MDQTPVGGGRGGTDIKSGALRPENREPALHIPGKTAILIQGHDWHRGQERPWPAEWTLWGDLGDTETAKTLDIT